MPRSVRDFDGQVVYGASPLKQESDSVLPSPCDRVMLRARNRPRAILTVMTVGVLLALSPHRAANQARAFQVEEATINDLHRAIQEGRTTCRAVVQQYIDRAQAYNGACTRLVTREGSPIPAVAGSVRAGIPIAFPTDTVPVSRVLPDFDQYAGMSIELGRMEPTISDPAVQMQVGLRVGVPNAGKLNALETLNIRGERSVSCKASCDAHPSTGALPAACPSECDAFRRQPDALERASELDGQYGRKPDLAQFPMYCVVVSLKSWYDAKDMRATGGNDVNFAMDAPKFDSPDIADLRSKGAIIYGVATANGTSMTADGSDKGTSFVPGQTLDYGLWGGQACNPYDTERVPRGTSNGSGVSVAANLVSCSICEQTGASCKGPASRNNVVALVATKGVMMDGGLGFPNSGDRAGIHCRTVADSVAVLDAVKGYQSRDAFTALPNGLIPPQPYKSFLIDDEAVPQQPLSGVRVGVAREFMVKHTRNDEAISDQIDKEIKRVLRDALGAELVESVDPMYPDDPEVPNMKYTFQDALAEILPLHAPEYFWQTDRSGQPEFAVPGHDVRSVDYLVALALRRAPLSPKLTLRRVNGGGLGDPHKVIAVERYLRERGDVRVNDWASWVANAKWKDDVQRAGSENALTVRDPRPPADVVSYLKMQTVLRLVVQKVIDENRIDVFVNPETTLPPYRLGGPSEPPIADRNPSSCCSFFTALLGGPEIDVPAGYTQVVYEPRFVLSPDKQRYESVTGTVRSMLPHPMPISLMVWSGPGRDPAVIRVASAYEAATHHRVPPRSFGPLAHTPQVAK